MGTTENETGTMKNSTAPSESTAGGGSGAEVFIDKREVARRLGRTVRTVNNLMRNGRIPFYKFDSRISFRWSEVEARLTRPCAMGTPGGAR